MTEPAKAAGGEYGGAMGSNVAGMALAKVAEPFDATVEFTIADACKARGWSVRRAHRALVAEVKAGRLTRRRVIDGYRRYYAYRMTEVKP